MAEQAFGIKEFNLIGSGTPTISSPNNLNLKAATVAISTNISIGGTMSVIGGGTFGIGSTVGIGSTLYVSHGDLYLRDNHEININNDSLTLRGKNGGNSFITNFIDQSDGSPGNFYISNYTGDIEIGTSEHFSVKTNYLSGGEQAILATQNGSVALYHNDNTSSSIKVLETSTTGVTITGTLAATAVTGDGSGLTNLPAASPSTSDIQVVYEITGSSSSSNGYRFSGNAVDSSTPNPDLYLIRGKQYRFINNSGGTHPFEIRVSNGGAAYDTGVIGNNSSSGNIDFVPEFDAPAQLVYQCVNHGGMVGNIYLRGANGNEMNVGVTTFSQTPSSASGVSVTSQGLDHYEEGTWTPVLRHYISGSFQPPAGSAGTVKGHYTRVGNVCYINATFSAFNYSNLNAISSYAQITDLPFPASSSAGHVSVIHTTGTAFTSGSGYDVVFITSGGNTYLNSKTNNSSLDWAVINSGSRYLYISGFYFVD